MKIARIGYGYTQNLGNYESAKVYAESDIQLDDETDLANSGEEVWQKLEEEASLLRIWVHTQLPKPQTVQDLKAESRTLERKIDQGIEALTRLRNKWDEAIALLEKHGITITEEFPWQPKAPEQPPDIPDFPLLDADEVVEYEDPDEDPDQYF